MLHKTGTYEPDSERHEIYNELYELWKDSYTALAASGFYKKLNDFQLKHA
jgi:sugar (pentulose or hexulose) kinase